MRQSCLIIAEEYAGVHLFHLHQPNGKAPFRKLGWADSPEMIPKYCKAGKMIEGESSCPVKE